jgi:hypothetical protein
VLTTSGTYPWSFVTQIFHNGQPSHGGDRSYIYSICRCCWNAATYIWKVHNGKILEEQELFTLPEHLSSPPVFSGVRITRSLLLCVCFVDRFFGHFVLFSFDHCVVSPSSIYGFWLPLWYLQTILTCDWGSKTKLADNRSKGDFELRCSGRVNSSCSSSGTCRVNLVTNPVINHEWGKNREVLTTSGTYPYTSKLTEGGD